MLTIRPIIVRKDACAVTVRSPPLLLVSVSVLVSVAVGVPLVDKRRTALANDVSPPQPIAQPLKHHIIFLPPSRSCDPLKLQCVVHIVRDRHVSSSVLPLVRASVLSEEREKEKEKEKEKERERARGRKKDRDNECTRRVRTVSTPSCAPLASTAQRSPRQQGNRASIPRTSGP